MRENILEPDPSADIAVYVVWEPMLGGRRRNAEEATTLIADPRVKQFWNDEFVAGEFFKEAAFGRTAWDIYFLYGPEANWEEAPAPLVSSGFTVYSSRQQLQMDLAQLLTN